MDQRLGKGSKEPAGQNMVVVVVGATCTHA